MDWGHILIMTLAITAGVFGIIGSLIPGLPGPPVSWTGMLAVFFWGGPGMSRGDISLTALIIMTILMVAVTVSDYILPAKMTKLTGGGKYATKGANAGLILACIIGIFCFLPGIVAMLILPFVGAFLFELIAGHKSGDAAAKGALGAFLGLISGTGIKLIYSCVALCMII